MGWARGAAAAIAAAVVAVGLSPLTAVGAAAAATGGPKAGARCPFTATTEVAGRWNRTLLTVRTPAAIVAALASPGVRRLGNFPSCTTNPGRDPRSGTAGPLPPSGGCLDALPRHVAWFYPLTRGHSAADGWILPMLATGERSHAPRRAWAVAEFGRPGWTAADVAAIVDLLEAPNATAAAAAAVARPSAALAVATASAVYRRVTRGAGVPAAVVAASAATPGTLAAAVVPGRAAKAKRGLIVQREWAAAVLAARQAEAADAAEEAAAVGGPCPAGAERRRRPPAPHPQSGVELVQGVVEAAFAVPRLLLAVAAAEAAAAEAAVAADGAAAAPDPAGTPPGRDRLPPLPTVILPDVTRITVGDFRWAASSPRCPAGSVPGGTLVKAAVGDAAVATRSPAWLFGAAWSAGARPCAAAGGILALAGDVRSELRRRAAARQGGAGAQPRGSMYPWVRF